MTTDVVSLEILEAYCDEYPSHQNAIDVFEGDWSSIFPGRFGIESGGFAGLFEDMRIDWMVERLGGDISGWRVLDLGPLEGGHAYSLEAKHGAGEIVAIEANQRAYLKCLIAKEVLEMTKTKFLLGDFNRYMTSSGERFDLVVASGVLYHMQNPAEHIKLLCESADSVFVWTHYFDQALIDAIGPSVAKKFRHEDKVDFEGYEHTVYQQDYLEALGWGGFCGAGNEFANWIELKDIHGLFEKYGFEISDTGFEQTDHGNGPSLAFLARRKG